MPLLGVDCFGGILGPLLMLLGLHRLGALTGSLLLNLEAPLTILLAVLLFGEHIGRYATASTALVLIGAALLRLQSCVAQMDGWGMLCIASAWLCWALDKNLTQQLSLRDPVALVRVKTLAVGGINLLIALSLGASFPSKGVVASAQQMLRPWQL